MAKRPIWYVNAARRTAWSIARRLARPDDAFARAWLEPEEYRLYLRMDPRDRQHAGEVAQRLLARCPGAPVHLVAAALLHDVGKSSIPFHVAERVLAHLLPPPPLPPEPRLTGLRGALQVKRHHDRYGADLIRAAGGRERVAALVAGLEGATADAEAALLRRIDDDT